MFSLIMMEVLSWMSKSVEGVGLNSSCKANARVADGVCVSHILFADDTFLFCDADVEQIFHIQMLLLCFQVVTSLKVNVCNSEMAQLGQ